MTTDLESRLRDYAADIDEAIDGPLAVSGSPPEGSRWLRYGVPTTAAALVALAAGVLLAGRGPERASPATAATEPTLSVPDELDTLLEGPGDWTTYQPDEFEPVRLADGAFTWWALHDEEFAPDGFTLNTIVACAGWEADVDGVRCSELLDTPLTPSAMYGTSGRAVDVYTNRRGTDLDEYVQVLGGVSGTVEAVDVGDVEGRALDLGGTPHKFVLSWHPRNGPVVALVTTGLDFEEVIDAAHRIEPADSTALAPLPLTLAALEGGEGEIHVGDTLLGAVVEGEVCAFPATHLATDLQDPCVALGEVPMVLTMDGLFGNRGFFAGLVGANVNRVRVDFVDGTSLSIMPEVQPVGRTKAFLASAGVTPPASITALSESGEALMTIDLRQSASPIVPITEPAEPESG